MNVALKNSANFILRRISEEKMNYSRGRKIYIITSAVLLSAVMITIFILSAQNGAESSSTSGFFTKFIEALFGQPANEAIIRTLAHFCEFAGLGFLMCNLLFALKDKLKPFSSGFLSLGYAVTDEIHQIFVPGRACQFTDWLVDFGGIILGVVVFCVLIIIKTNLMRTLHHPE